MAKTIVGYFQSWAAAEAAVSRLKEAGFRSDQVGIAARSAHPEREAAHGEVGFWDRVKSFFEGQPAEPYSGEAAGQEFDDRVVTPQSYGSEDVKGSLGDLEVPEEQARYFHHHLSRGNEGVIVTVRADGQEQLATSIIEENGGDIGKEAARYSYAQSEAVPSGEQNIRLYGEVLRVHKDRVNRGEVRLRKEVHTTTQTVEVPVTREEIVIERVPVSGEVPADRAEFGESEIRIPLSEERASVDKQAVVREEVRVGKKEVTKVESFNEQVRNEDLKTEEDVKGRKSA